MKPTYLLLLLFLLPFAPRVRAQETLNTTLRDRLDYTDLLSDVWGYVAPDGTEYALVGLRNSLSIVSLADPDNVVEVANVAPAMNVTSPWRDMKTYGEYAYVVADRGDFGITVVDLSNLPASVSAQEYNTNNTSGADLIRAHNIFIDESTGLAYVAGSNVNSGGMVIYDIATTPGVPIFKAFGPSVYSHDVYVENGVMYTSEIYRGEMGLYDVTDPNDITFLGSAVTPTSFTHNVWATPDGQYAFTTDEKSNASTAAYDVSDPTDIRLLDEFRPRRSLGTGALPHNVHVRDNYLIISHYNEGVEIVDATDPANLVEVAYYDPNAGGSGTWGAYPFLPSGLVLLTDISAGLYVVEVDYRRAARLAGTVTDAITGLPLNDVTVSVTSVTGLAEATNALGHFKTGVAAAGDYVVTLTKPGYEEERLNLSLVSGEELALNVALAQVVLPVVLTDFTARAETKAVRLDWSTAGEVESDRFVVERSADGTVFAELGEIPAGGNAASVLTYAFTDSAPLEGVSYYRLRQVDVSGLAAYSPVRRVDFTGEVTVSVFPNPVGEMLWVRGLAGEPVKLFRADGVLVRTLANTGNGISVADLAAGAYYLKVGTETVRFVKR